MARMSEIFYTDTIESKLTESNKLSYFRVLQTPQSAIVVKNFSVDSFERPFCVKLKIWRHDVYLLMSSNSI